MSEPAKAEAPEASPAVESKQEVTSSSSEKDLAKTLYPETESAAKEAESKTVSETKAPEKQATEKPEPSKEAAKAEEIKYELKLPEGSPLEASYVEKIATYAKERGLSNEQAQALLERESSTVADYKSLTRGWVDDVRNDKEIGGDHFNENVGLALSVVEKYGTDSLKTALKETGYGNHPELVRIFARIGKAMAPDRLVKAGTQSAPQKRPIEEILYGGTKS